MSFDTQLITIPVFTVLKVLLVALIGGYTGKHFAFPAISGKGISTMTVKIFLPAMLFARMAVDMNLDLLLGGYGWAVILCFIPLTLGYVCSNILKVFIKNEEFHGLFRLGSTFQNTVSFGLGVTQSLAGPSWINADAKAEFATVVFLWNLPHSIAVFGGGTILVRNGKEDEIRSTYARDLAAYEQKVAERDERRRIKNNTEPLTNNAAVREVVSVDEVSPVTASSTSHLLLYPTTATANKQQQKRRQRRLANESPRHQDADDAEGLATNIGGRGVIVHEEALPIEIVTTGGKQYSTTDSSALSPISSPNTSLTAEEKEQRAAARRAKRAETQAAMAAIEEDKAREAAEDAALKPPTKPTLPPKKEGMDALREVLVEVFTNITNAASFVGIAIGLIPPLKWLFTGNPFGLILVNAMDVLGAANVPLTLLQLGTNLTSTQKAPKKRFITKTETVRDEVTQEMVLREVQVEAPPRSFVTEYIDSLEVPGIFILLVALIRLVIIPTAFLIIFLTLRSMGNIPILGPIPTSKAFQLTVLIESCGPTAINTNILCTMFQYKTVAYSQALLGIYCISIVTTALWLSLYLWLMSD